MRANVGMLLVILAAFMLVTVDGYGQMISIEPASVESPAAGERLTLNINIVGGMNVAGYEVTVTFDSTALGDVSIVNADYLPEGAFIVPAVVTETSAKLAATAIGATAEGDGTLATVTFTVVEAKASAIGLDAIILDPTTTEIASVVQGGTVTGPAAETPAPIEDRDASEVIGRWAVQSIDGDPIDKVFGDDELFEGAEILGVSEWTFYDDGRWHWVTAFETGTEDPFSSSFSFKIGGTYTITGSSYTLIFDEETIALLEIEPSDATTTGTWIKVGSTLTLSHDDGTVIVMHAVDTAADPPGIEPPQPPIKMPPPVASTHRLELELAAGLNMISLPLMPAEPYTASSFAAVTGATVVIQLDTAMSQFVGFTADQAGDGFAIEGGQGYIVNVPGGGMVTFEGTAWGDTVETAAAPSVQLPSTGWAFVLSGDLRETEAGVSYTVVAKNQRTGEVATRQVSSEDKVFNTVWADLSRQSVIESGDTLEVILFDDLGNIVSGPFTHQVELQDLRNAYLSLPLTVGDVHPAKTLLGQNFPNPFNPETWIPYQLEKSGDVVLQIYDTAGGVVRTIDLGFKPQGFYYTRSTAAYWDGRNNMGEQVASGVYFYSLQTPDFSATRKMLILK